MVIGLGVDIIEIERIKESINKYGDQFLSKIYTKKELDYCLAKSNKYQHLAARFAAKEAVYKALATGWEKENVGWQNIEIFNDSTGMPHVNLNGEISRFLTSGNNLKISLSHSRDYVVCVAIIYKDNNDSSKSD